MHRQPLALLENTPELHCGDIYLFNSTGKIISSREYGLHSIENIFGVISARDLGVLRAHLQDCYLRPLILIESQIGLMIIDVSLFARHGIMTALVPNFSREEVLAITQKHFADKMRVPDYLAQEIQGAADVYLTDEHEDFAKRIHNMHRSAPYYQVHGKTNGELATMMCEVAMAVSDFYGCRSIVSIEGVGVYELLKKLCVESYIFSLTLCSLASRKYCADRSMTMKICFDSSGICLEMAFILANCLGDFFKLEDTEEITKLKRGLQTNGGLYEINEKGRDVTLKIHPYFLEPDSTDIKKKKIPFIYNE